MARRESPCRFRCGAEDRKVGSDANNPSGHSHSRFERGVIEIGCMAHARRKLHDLYANHRSEIAEGGVRYFTALYENEREARELKLDVDGRQRLSTYLAIQRNNSDTPTIAAPNPMLLQPHEYRNRMTPTKKKGTATTRSIFFGSGLRRQLSCRTRRSDRNAWTEPNCFARSNSNADVWAGKPHCAQVSVPPGELRPQCRQTQVYCGAST